MVMPVKFVDLVQRYEDEKVEIQHCIDRVLSKGHLVLTDEVAELEQEVADFCGVSSCVSLNSGTDALMMALWGAEIGRGDEVIVPNISFIASVGAIVHVGATPVICDVGNDFLIDVKKLEPLITTKTKAIMPVHWTGRTCNMAAINKIAEAHGLVVIEDAAQSMGSYVNGRHSGTWGLAGGVSCHPLKNLNALGDGGLLITNNSELVRKVRLYRNHGLRARDDVEIFGVNSRLDVLSAEVLKYRLTRLKGVNERRNINAIKYMERLDGLPQITFVKPKKNEIEARVMFLGLFESRDLLQKALLGKGIETMVYYGKPLSAHKASIDMGLPSGNYPVSEQLCSKVLALPHHQYITDEQISFVCESIESFYVS
ncbi:MAG: DegT/DnrJ/EryC1/StrS family aminotransferase [Pseudomonadota bacterium]|nr:DegT/DnrJ/EryC1/StrS family aminotransferase [Pseudomonadota bacterium]